jgi:hypothetical protein
VSSAGWTMEFLRRLLAVSYARGGGEGRANVWTVFGPDENPLGVPLVQVSLYGNEDPDQHYALGAALQSLRDENIVIVGSGMAVHNLR